MKITKFSRMIYVFCIIAAFLSVSAFASQLAGSGTSDDPYLIGSAEDLIAFSDLAANDSFEESFFKLSADIELLSANDFTYNDKGVIDGVKEGVTPFAPISSAQVPFMGSFDGNGYTISGLYVKDSNYAGLFARVNNASIANVTVFDSLCVGNSYAGMLCAYAEGDTVIENINVSGTVMGQGEGLASYIGGIVGMNSKATSLESCVSYATVSGARAYGAYAGGVAGINMGEISYSSFGGAVHAESAYNSAACGGIAGVNTGTLTSCLSDGYVSGETSALITESYVGGVVGRNTSGGIVTKCVNNSEVKSSCYNPEDNLCGAGGIVGINSGSHIYHCTNNGTITADYVYCGGIAGMIDADEADSSMYAVLNDGSISAPYGVGGGLAGIVYGNSGNTLTISGALSLADVTAIEACADIAVKEGNNAYEISYSYRGKNAPTAGTGTFVEQSVLTSGNAIEGLEADTWSYVPGKYPEISTNSDVIKVNYVECDDEIIEIYTGSAITPQNAAVTHGVPAFSKTVKDTGLYTVVITADTEGLSNVFAPAPKRVFVAVVNDVNKAQILSTEYDEINKPCEVKLSIYMPGTIADADFVSALYSGNKLLDVKAQSVTVTGKTFECAIALPDVLASATEITNKSIKIFVFEDMQKVNVLCESVEI